MIAAFVAIPASEDIGADDSGEIFENQAGNYRGSPGLFRKYNIYGKVIVGGVCVWGNREIAEAIYTFESCASVMERHSVVEKYLFFDTPVVVGNA